MDIKLKNKYEINILKQKSSKLFSNSRNIFHKKIYRKEKKEILKVTSKYCYMINATENQTL